jgi:uncharacterized RDD family membrane protein YckC
MSMRNPGGTALRHRLAVFWHPVAAGFAYALGLFALVVEAPALAPWTDDPR